MKISPYAALASVSLASGLASAADVVTLYENNFESASSIGSEWITDFSRSYSADLTWFLGRHAAQAVSLRLAVPPLPDPDPAGDSGIVVTSGAVGSIAQRLPFPDGGSAGGGGPLLGGSLNVPNISFTHTKPIAPVVYSIIFDLYVIDSWDANTDSFAVAVNGTMLFDEFFSNFHLDTNFRMPDEGPFDMGFNTWPDTIYRGIRLDFELDPSVDFMTIDFIGRTDQSLSDESWGIDNLRVLSSDGTLGRTAVPAPGAAALLALGLGGLMRRRR